jgi:hypothetical protein
LKIVIFEFRGDERRGESGKGGERIKDKIPGVQIDLNQIFLNLQRLQFSRLVHTSCYSADHTLV